MKVDRVFCPECDELRKCSSPGANHAFHLLMTLFTLGLWPIVWAGAAMASRWTCDSCGEDVSSSVKRARRMRTNAGRRSRIGRAVKGLAYGGAGVLAIASGLALIGALSK